MTLYTEMTATTSWLAVRATTLYAAATTMTGCTAIAESIHSTATQAMTLWLAETMVSAEALVSIQLQTRCGEMQEPTSSRRPLSPELILLSGKIFVPTSTPAREIRRISSPVPGRQSGTAFLNRARLRKAHSFNRVGNAVRFVFQISNFKFQKRNFK